MKITNDNIRTRLIEAGLRPTRQRLQLYEWLYKDSHKHFTAEDMYDDIKHGDSSVSLATVYNTLSAFTQAGLINTVSLEAGRVYYDTNIDPHYHVYDAQNGSLIDIDAQDIEVKGLPDLPDDQVIDRIDIIIRTRST